MAKESKPKKTGFWAGVKAEFRKIVWPEPAQVGRESVAVVVVSAIIAVFIVLIDMVIRYGVDFLINFKL